MHLPSISRVHMLPILFTLGLVNPFTYYVLHASRTYFWVVPFTLLIWFSFKRKDLEKNPTLEKGAPVWEMMLGLALLTGVVLRTLLEEPSSRIFGLFDMLILFVALVLILFGIRSLRIFWVPASFLAIIGFGYALERVIVDWAGYAESLANLVAFLVRVLGGQAESEGSVIVLSEHGASRLLIDYGCTGIKGIMAFGFISFIPIMEARRGRKGKALWIAIALIGFVLASILRLVAVVFAVMAWGQVAVDYHTTIGFAFFMTWLVVVTYYGSAPETSVVATVPPKGQEGARST